MSPRDFLLLVAVCLTWATNAIVCKVAFDAGAPPLIYAAIRSGLITIAVLPWLFPLPKNVLRLATAAFLIGGGSFGLVFVALAIASPSGVAIVQQLSVPMTTLLSVVVLGELIGWRRGAGIALAFAGVMLVMWQPGSAKLEPGLLLAAISAVASSVGAVMLKQILDLQPLRFQAWVGLTGVVPLLLASAVFETRQVERLVQAGWTFVGPVIFSALVVSVVTHTIYYWLVRRYDASLVAPLMLMVPLFTIGLGIWFTGDQFDLRMAIGSAVAFAGVLVIVLRSSKHEIRPAP